MSEETIAGSENSGSSRLFRFPPFTFDASAGLLNRGGEETQLPPKAAQVLEMLLARHGQLVTKQKLLEVVWDGATVTEFSLTSAIKTLRDALGDDARDPIYIQTLHRRGYRFIGGVSDAGSVPAIGEIRSLAVLPFDNLSGDPDREAITDGMSNLLISKLGGMLADRHVTPWASAKAMKDRSAGISEAAAALAVEGIVYASVISEGDGVLVNTNLYHGPSETPLWNAEFRKDGGDNFGLVEEISLAIARELGAERRPGSEVDPTNGSNVDPEAQELWFRGLDSLERRSPESIRQARSLFEQAIGQDDSFAQAYAALARSYELLAVYYVVPSRDAFAHATENANKALERDGTIAAAHAALGTVRGFGEWNSREADLHYQQALRLNPSSAIVHANYGQLLIYWGGEEHTRKGFGEIAKALELDPESLPINWVLGFCLYLSRRYPEAIAQFGKVIEMDPVYANAYLFQSAAYAEQRMFEEARRLSQQAVDIVGPQPMFLAMQAHAHARADRRDAPQALLADLLMREGRTETYVAPDLIAMIYAALGDKDRALVWLQRAAEEGAYGLVYWRLAPWADPVKDDARFKELMNQSMDFSG